MTGNGNGKWRPRWWVATTTVITFGLGLWCSIHEILGSGERPATLGFCSILLALAPVTLLLERLRG